MTEEPQEQLLFERDDDGRFHAVLPSGKRPVIIPVLADKIHRIYAAFKQPDMPQRVMEVPGSGMGQKIDDPNDPTYVRDLTTWYMGVQYALFRRFVLDALVVPEDNEWAWKMADTGITIPENGPDRQWAYVEETLEELITEGPERNAFIEAVRMISVPTEAGIRLARRRFWDEMGVDPADETEAAEGNDTGEAGV